MSSGRSSGDEDARAGAHRVADQDCRLAELLDQSDDIPGGLLIAVGGKRGVAVAMSAQVRARHPVASLAQRRSQEAIAAAQVAHSGHEHQQRPLAGDVIRDAPLGTRDVGGLGGQGRLPWIDRIL